ncbi:zinc ribbon domain-containing protein [Legionella spiritensis]|uniref:Putative zinc-ribbon domain-containing protein n=1 Tax=Legionella spiritensis TaxID=452 RepID=A0A0W0YYX5_LEGSP|nr:zinc ribbon domain-containing protein [Legionella spiritensis]KTD61855.1 hypothetical protein Lspi_2485 [Legionella spiritensis]SNV31450.1 Predicted membrane protein [Legionella spiritensis]
MAMVGCPQCKKSIASDALECPHCGHPLRKQDVEIEQKPTPARNYGWGTFIYLLLIVAGLFMLFEGRLTGLILLIIGALLIIGRYKLWGQTGKKIR